MNKKTIITALFALIAMGGHAKVWKTIKAPEAITCINVNNGELKAREVITQRAETRAAAGAGNVV